MVKDINKYTRNVIMESYNEKLKIRVLCLPDFLVSLTRLWSTEAQPAPPETSKMESFVIIVKAAKSD